MTKKILIISLLILIIPLTAAANHSCTIYPYKIETANKKFLFVMRDGYSNDKPDHWPSPLSQQYPASGMYLNDGSNIPLWTVDWSADVLMPADGIHIIRLGRWRWRPTEEGYDYNEEAISFFANGKLLKSYRVSDLVILPRLLPESSAHFHWLYTIPPAEGARQIEQQILGYQCYLINCGVAFDDQIANNSRGRHSCFSIIFQVRFLKKIAQIEIRNRLLLIVPAQQCT